MKVKIIRHTHPGKGKKVMEVKNEIGDIDDIGSVFDRSFESIGSSIQILNGSFSQLKPIEELGEAKKEEKPKATSTPYEDISDEEETKEDGGEIPEPQNHQDRNETEEEEEEDVNLTFDFNEDVSDIRDEIKEYVQDLANFVKRTQNMVKTKIQKRTVLLRKLKKYQKKVKMIQESLTDIDQIITFGNNLPRLMDNI